MHLVLGYRRQIGLLVRKHWHPKSNLANDYRTPGLMFVHKNGTTQVVPQVGGMLAYYLLQSNKGETIEPYPEGFQMITGDNRLRNFTGPVPDPEKSLWKASDKTQLSLGQKAVGMNCLNYKKNPEPSMYRHFLPDKAYLDANCENGIRAELCTSRPFEIFKHYTILTRTQSSRRAGTAKTRIPRTTSLTWRTPIS
jgi:hypothetical protein